MRNRSPKVNIIVLNHNGKDVLRKCLASVFRVDYPDFEIVVVDNASDDGSIEEAKKDFSKATFIKNSRNLGFSAGNNIGIRYSLEKQAEYVLLLNSDTEVEKDFLGKLIGLMGSDPKIGVLSPTILEGDSDRVWFSGGRIDWKRMRTTHLRDRIDGAAFRRTEFVSGCAMLVRKEVFAKIGLLDEEFFLYWEDADFSVRAARQGFRLAVAKTDGVRHFEKSRKNKPSKTYWLVLSGLIFFRKNAHWSLAPWGRAYLAARKAKNAADIRKDRFDETALAVRKAYSDFAKLGK